MPGTDMDITKKAEVSHMVGIIAHCVVDPFSSKVQGGFEEMARSFILDNSFSTSVCINEPGKRVPTATIYHRVAEVLLQSIDHAKVNSTRVNEAFA